MKKVWCVVCAAVLCAVLSSCASHEVKYRSPGPDVSTEFALSAEAANRVGREYPIYKPVFERESSPEEYDRKLFRAFGVGNTEGEALDNEMKYTCDNGASLTIYNGGSYYYDFVDAFTSENNQTDEEALAMTLDFLQSRGIWPSSEPFDMEVLDGYSARDNNDKYSVTYKSKQIRFYQTSLGGYRLLTNKEGLFVHVQQGGVCRISNYYVDYSQDRMVSCLSLEEITRLNPKDVGTTHCLRDPDGEEEFPYSYDSDTPVIFTDVEICLGKSDASYQPVYVFKGTRCDVNGKEHQWEWEVPALKTH